MEKVSACSFLIDSLIYTHNNHENRHTHYAFAFSAWMRADLVSLLFFICSLERMGEGTAGCRRGRAAWLAGHSESPAAGVFSAGTTT